MNGINNNNPSIGGQVRAQNERGEGQEQFASASTQEGEKMVSGLQRSMDDFQAKRRALSSTPNTAVSTSTSNALPPQAGLHRTLSDWEAKRNSLPTTTIGKQHSSATSGENLQVPQGRRTLKTKAGLHRHMASSAPAVPARQGEPLQNRPILSPKAGLRRTINRANHQGRIGTMRLPHQPLQAVMGEEAHLGEEPVSNSGQQTIDDSRENLQVPQGRRTLKTKAGIHTRTASAIAAAKARHTQPQQDRPTLSPKAGLRRTINRANHQGRIGTIRLPPQPLEAVVGEEPHLGELESNSQEEIGLSQNSMNSDDSNMMAHQDEQPHSISTITDRLEDENDTRRAQRDNIAIAAATVEDSDLVRANPVSEDEEQQNLPQARPMDLEQRNKIKQGRQLQFRRRISVLFVILLTTLVVALVVPLTRRNRSRPNEEELSSLSPATVSLSTAAPTQAPSMSPTYLIDDLPEESLAAIHLATPQNQAYKWLRDHTNRTNLPNWRKQQLFALACLYYAFDGPTWPIQYSNWLDYNVEECEWYSFDHGIFLLGSYIDAGDNYDDDPVCTSDGRLRRLALYDITSTNAIGATMPPEVALLTDLENVFIVGDFNSSVSEVIGASTLARLPKLSSLSFYDSELTGTIPSDIGLLHQIEKFVLSYNTDKFLEGGRSFITGTLPTEVGQMASCQEFMVGGHLLVGTLPTELGLLSHLRKLELTTSAAITGTIPTEFALLHSLERVWVNGGYTIISGTIPIEVLVHKNLTTLAIQGNFSRKLALPNDNVDFLQSFVEQHGSGKTKLLLMDQMTITGTLSSHIGSLTNLSALSFNDNELTGSIPSELGMLKSLEELDLSLNNLAGSLPTELGSLQLRHANLSSNALRGTLHNELYAMTSLSQLSLANNFLSGVLSSEIGTALSLEKLSLKNNSLHGIIPSAMGSLSNLTWLELQHNFISGRVPSQFGLLTALTYLDIRFNALNDVLASELGLLTSLGPQRTSKCSYVSGGFEHCRIQELPGGLFLHNNLLRGMLPKELRLLTNLTQLDLSRNQFSGIIPASLFASLTQLELLNFSRNALRGPIPSELGLVGQNLIPCSGFFCDNAFLRPQEEFEAVLKYLDLSYNSLSSTVPSELGLHTSLQILDLSRNSLSGSIPSELGKLSSWPDGNISFVGNTNMTGQLPVELCTWFCSSRLYLAANPSSESTNVSDQAAIVGTNDCDCSRHGRH